jgi:MFS family permease
MFSMLTSSNAIQWIMYATIPDAAKAAFGLSTSELNMLSSVYMIVFIPGFLVSCSVVERMSLRVCLVAGCLLNVAGAALKLGLAVAMPHYAVLIAAQCVLAVAQIFLLSAPPLVADEWFPPQQRAAATAVGSMANNVGIALGMLLAPLMVTQDTAATPHDFVGFFVLQLAMSAVPLLGITLGMPSAPLSAAMAAVEPASINGKSQDMSTVVAVRRVASTLAALALHRDYRLLFLSFSISIGSIWAMSSLLAQVLQPFGISNTVAGFMGAGNLAAGAVVAVMVGRWIDTHRSYKTPLLIANLVNTLALSIMCLGLTLWFPSSVDATDGSGSEEASASAKAVIIVLYVVAGTAQNTVIPVCFEYAMEVTFPLPNSVPGGLLMAGGNMISLLMVLVGSDILGSAAVATQTEAVNTFAMVLGIAAVGGVVVLGAGETLARMTSGH